MKKIVSWFLIIIILATTVSAFSYQQNDKKGFNNAMTKCNIDSDCHITSSTCCSCNSGGRQIAVNEFGLKYFDWWKCNYCSPQIRCRMVYMCIAEEARCVNKTCELI